MNKKVLDNLTDYDILEGKRVFTTNKKYKRFLNSTKNRFDIKPSGLWYSIGSHWVKWCLSEGFGGIGKYFYEIDLNENSNILFLNSRKSVRVFSERYKKDGDLYDCITSNFIDWDKVKEDYDGIEINPYFRDLRNGVQLVWYNVWDVPSGCIWDENAQKNIKLILKRD